MRIEQFDTIRGVSFVLMFIFHIFVVLNIFNKTSYSLSNPILHLLYYLVFHYIYHIEIVKMKKIIRKNN